MNTLPRISNKLLNLPFQKHLEEQFFQLVPDVFDVVGSVVVTGVPDEEVSCGLALVLAGFVAA